MEFARWKSVLRIVAGGSVPLCQEMQFAQRGELVAKQHPVQPCRLPTPGATVWVAIVETLVEFAESNLSEVKHAVRIVCLEGNSAAPGID